MPSVPVLRARAKVVAGETLRNRFRQKERERDKWRENSTPYIVGCSIREYSPQQPLMQLQRIEREGGVHT